MSHEKTVSSITRAWYYFLDTDAKNQLGSQLMKVLEQRDRGDRIWCTGCPMNVKSHDWHEGPGRNTSGSRVIEQVPWHWLMVWWSHTRTYHKSLAIFLYPLIPTFSAPVVLWPFSVGTSRLNQKCWRSPSVLTCLGWKQLGSDHAGSSATFRSVDLFCADGWERGDTSSEERWLLVEWACSQSVMVSALHLGVE